MIAIIRLATRNLQVPRSSRAPLLVFAASALFNQEVGAQDWPHIALPKGVQAFDIGSQVVAQGLPMRVQGFVSAEPPARLADWFRRQLGKPVVENTIARKLILGRLEGTHYLTVQIEPAGNGSRGLVAVTDLQSAYETQTETQTFTGRWLARLPAGSRLLSETSSQDAARFARHLVITNTHSEELNRDSLIGMMADDGYVLEREGQSAGKLSVPPNTESRTLFFKGRGKEAIATIRRDREGRTAVVINTVNVLEQFK